MTIKRSLYDIFNIIKACIVLHKTPPTVEEVERDFEEFCGARIPHDHFGYPSTKSLLLVIPDVYIVFDEHDRDTFIVYSQKSKHMLDLIQNTENGNHRENRTENNNLPKLRKEEKEHLFCRLINFDHYDCVTPLFFNHQAMGDDFFVDLAENKFGYRVPDDSIKIGKCKADQTISELTEEVRSSQILSTKAVVMIGTADLLKGTSERKMLKDLRCLVKTLKERKIDVTLVTLIKPVDLYYNEILKRRMYAFNNAIRKYARDRHFRCKVIDLESALHFHKNVRAINTISYHDRYQVFSCYTRNVFFSELKTNLF